MRDGSSYRANRRKRSRKHEQKLIKMAQELTPEQARRALGVWARTGGKVNVLKGETEDGRS